VYYGYDSLDIVTTTCPYCQQPAPNPLCIHCRVPEEGEPVSITQYLSELFERWHEHHRHHRHRAVRLQFAADIDGIQIQGDNMTFTLAAGQSVPFTVTPIKADGTASNATLSALAFVSSDPTIFTVALDPATPNGGILSAVAGGTAILTGTATATEPDGTTTEQITGAVTIAVATVAPAPAAALQFVFGTPALKK
jgi:hypothetical protein